MAGPDLQQRPCRAGRSRLVLFRFLRRAKTHADQLGELGPADLRGPADRRMSGSTRFGDPGSLPCNRLERESERDCHYALESQVEGEYHAKEPDSIEEQEVEGCDTRSDGNEARCRDQTPPGE